jgi:uncharacterized protein (DUF2141 family)
MLFILLMINCKKKESPPPEPPTPPVITNDYAYIDCQVIDFDNANGQVVVGLFNSEAEWDKSQDGIAYREYFIGSLSDPLNFFIDTLPEGTFAIKTYHDENSNNECDMNLLGIPTEKFGFSNNPSIGLSGEPSYDECKFTISLKDTASITIDLIGF